MNVLWHNTYAFFCYNFVGCSPLPTQTITISVVFGKIQKFTKCSLCLVLGQFYALAATSTAFLRYCRPLINTH